jgi:hypothetical protein
MWRRYIPVPRFVRSIVYAARRRAATSTFQGVSTIHNMEALRSGRFGEIYERHFRIDPWNVASKGDRTRMRV